MHAGQKLAHALTGTPIAHRRYTPNRNTHTHSKVRAAVPEKEAELGGAGDAGDNAGEASDAADIPSLGPKSSA